MLIRSLIGFNQIRAFTFAWKGTQLQVYQGEKKKKLRSAKWWMVSPQGNKGQNFKDSRAVKSAGKKSEKCLVRKV